MTASLDRLTDGADDVTNTTACVACGYVHPWRGTPKQIKAMLAQLEGKCPGCITGKAARPDEGEPAKARRKDAGVARPGGVAFRLGSGKRHPGRGGHGSRS